VVHGEPADSCAARPPKRAFKPLVLCATNSARSKRALNAILAQKDNKRVVECGTAQRTLCQVYEQNFFHFVGALHKNFPNSLAAQNRAALGLN
jgi:hypothetical protein